MEPISSQAVMPIISVNTIPARTGPSSLSSEKKLGWKRITLVVSSVALIVGGIAALVFAKRVILFVGGVSLGVGGLLLSQEPALKPSTDELLTFIDAQLKLINDVNNGIFSPLALVKQASSYNSLNLLYHTEWKIPSDTNISLYSDVINKMNQSVFRMEKMNDHLLRQHYMESIKRDIQEYKSILEMHKAKLSPLVISVER